jgi:hypothetical protein
MRHTGRLGDASGGVGDASRDGPVTLDTRSPGASILSWVTLVTLVTLFCNTVSHRSHKLVRLLPLPRTPPRIPVCRRRGETLVISAWSCLSLGYLCPCAHGILATRITVAWSQPTCSGAWTLVMAGPPALPDWPRAPWLMPASFRPSLGGWTCPGRTCSAQEGRGARGASGPDHRGADRTG